MVLLLAMSLGAAPRSGSSGKGTMPMATAVDNEHYININNILMFVTNHGNFGRDLAGVFGYDYGTFYPYNTVEDIETGALTNSIVYASGLWIGAVDSATGETRLAVAEYEDEYVPGPMSGGSFLPDNPAFRVYKLYKDSLAGNPNQDYSDYKEFAVDQGAPVDEFGEPDMIGDQMLWAVYNDADPEMHGNDAGKTLPLGIEVRQTTFGYDRTDPLGNVIFLRLRIFNKGSNVLNECYFSLWSDPDLGQFTDDFVGCDTNLSLGFCYNGDNSDNQFGSSPPAVGYDFFQGPLEYTGDLADTARMWNQLWPEYRNKGMATFNKYINGTDPDNFTQTYNYMRGLNRDGSDYMYQGAVTKYFVSGDPVTGSGDLDATAADRRFMLSTGPIDFRPGDSTEILAAIVVGKGADRLSSVAVMKFNDLFAQDAYENNFVLIEPPAPPDVTVATNDNRITLTWTDTSEVYPGTYPFEGYTIWQGETVTGDENDRWTRITSFDIDNNVTDIYDQVVDPLTGAVEYRLTKKGVDDGLWHKVVLKEDAILGGRLRNLTEYYYKVEAYSYNPEVEVAKTPTSETIIKAIPQSPIAGTDYEYNFSDTVDVDHVGGSDGSVTPFVYNSKLFDGHTYQVTFSDTVGFRVDTVIEWNPPDPPETTFVSYDVVWHLVDLTTGDTLHGWQWDQSATEVFTDIMGIEYTVSGPPFELNDWEWEGATRPITGVDWGGSSFFGGLGLLGEFWGSSLTAADLVTVEIRWLDDGTGQSAYCYRRDLGYTFDGLHPNQNFEVWDVTADPPRQLNFAFVEHFDLADNDGQSADSIWNPGEQVNIDGSPNTLGGREYFWIFDSEHTGVEDPAYTVEYGFEDADVIYAGWVGWRDFEDNDGKPDTGDVWRIIPNFINTPSDTFTFVLNDTLFTGKNEDQLERINVVPNPFYLYGSYDPAPGNYTLKFQHLPGECTITIFNLAGDFIRRIDKTDPMTSTATWDVKTENGLVVASGIYLYVVEAPGFGNKIGKMAVFTETEVLKTY